MLTLKRPGWKITGLRGELAAFTCIFLLHLVVLKSQKVELFLLGMNVRGRNVAVLT